MQLNLPDDKSRELVYANEHPRVIATGGNGDFKIIYIRLRKSLSRRMGISDVEEEDRVLAEVDP